MKIKILLVLGIVTCSVFSHNNDDVNTFFSISFLKDHRAVRTALRNIGFRPITFTTSDNFSLAGLFLSRSHATCNVIVCAGWFPGKKEGMATFYALLPENCNILLFDARGHGQSEGSLLWGLWHYGVDEYKDILGAITWIKNTNHLPIVIGGICSGAFNAAHAIIHLEKNNELEQYNVKGLIFDSGWGSVDKIITTAPPTGIKKRLATLLTYIYRTKKDVAHSYIYRFTSYLITHVCSIGYLAAHVLSAPYDRLTNLYDKIDQISIPIFFIHSYGDKYAGMEDAIELARLTPHKQCWWIDGKSSHAKHHLLHKDTYKEKLHTFITLVTQ